VALGGPATFRRVAEELYPVLSRRQEPPASLDRLELDERGVAELRAARDRVLAAGATPAGSPPMEVASASPRAQPAPGQTA
jgi:hypothetical protein